MKNIRFEVSCPLTGCEKRFRIDTRKPTVLGSVRSRSVCPSCESSILFRIDRVLGKTVKGVALKITALGFKPSRLYLDALELAEQEHTKEVASEEANTNSVPVTDAVVS